MQAFNVIEAGADERVDGDRIHLDQHFAFIGLARRLFLETEVFWPDHVLNVLDQHNLAVDRAIRSLQPALLPD